MADTFATSFATLNYSGMLRFLREREIVHYQRFGESLRIVQEKLDSKNFYAVNPEFDR